MSVLPRLVTWNWRLKLAAFGLAVFLWAVVRAEAGRTSQRTVSGVPVLVQVNDLEWTTAGPPQPQVVDVRVGGIFGAFAAVGSELSVRVPVEQVTSRDTLIQLRGDWVVSSREGGLQVVGINPPQVRVRFEPTRRVAVPLSLRTTGSLPEDVALAQPLNLNPAVVRVQGRSSRVEQLDSLPVGPLDLSDIDESGSWVLPVDTTGFGDLGFQTTEATVEVRVEEAVEQLLAGIPVRVDSIPQQEDTVRLEMEPSTLQVRLRGVQNRVAAVEPESLAAVVRWEEVAQLTPGSARRVAVRISGVPDLVRAFSTSDSVVVRRLPVEERPDTAEPADTAQPGDTVQPPDTAQAADRAQPADNMGQTPDAAGAAGAAGADTDASPGGVR